MKNWKKFKRKKFTILKKREEESAAEWQSVWVGLFEQKQNKNEIWGRSRNTLSRS